jgi:hypothetical protein
MRKSKYHGSLPPDDAIYTGGPDLVEWLENLSEDDQLGRIPLRDPPCPGRQVGEGVSPTLDAR